jgi:hypothetical protein
MPTTEELSHILVDYAMIRASLEDDLLLLKEVKKRSDWPKWKVAIDVKVDQLVRKGMYKLVKLPPDHLVFEGLVWLWLQPLLAATATATSCLTYKIAPTVTTTMANWLEQLLSACDWFQPVTTIHMYTNL